MPTRGRYNKRRPSAACPGAPPPSSGVHEGASGRLATDDFATELVRPKVPDSGDTEIPSRERSALVGLSTIDELLDRDRRREKDGFPRKIKLGRLIRPGKGDKGAIVIVPTTVEEKFLHDTDFDPDSGGESGGAGKGEPGDVIGEEPVRPEQGGENGAAGQGDDAAHEMETSAYDLGKVLTEKFDLPNLSDRKSKRVLSRYTYEITDKHRGFGQVIDKKATLRKIIETNFGLGRISDAGSIDTSELLVAPSDRIYRILSREKEYESQAMVFFIRDYSGSMEGKCTDLVVSQHVLIYSWLAYQYAKRIETRFILHDTTAKEVPDFYTYYNSRVAGGTEIVSAYRLVNELVEKENLAADYNIYVFQGTDGDDADGDGEVTLRELRPMLGYANRVGITIAEHRMYPGDKSQVRQYLENSNLLKERRRALRMDVIDENADEARLIEGIRRLTAQETAAI